MELALVAALIVSNAAWLVYLDRRDRRHRDQLSELITRIQHPQLVNPRALETPLPPPPDPEPDERELAGQVFAGGLPDRLRAPEVGLD